MIGPWVALDYEDALEALCPRDPPAVPLPLVPTIVDFDLAGSDPELPSRVGLRAEERTIGGAVDAMIRLYESPLGPWCGYVRPYFVPVAKEPEAKTYAPAHGGYPTPGFTHIMAARLLVRH